MIILKKTLWTVLMLLTSLAVCAQEPQTNEDVSPELRILTPQKSSSSSTKNLQWSTLSRRCILYKDGKRYKLEFMIDYYDQSPALERAVAKYFFKDTVSNTLKDAFDSYLAQFSKDSYVYTNFNNFVYSFSMSRSGKVGSLQNFFLVLEWEDYTGDTITKTKKQWNLVYDIDDDKILSIDDVFTPTEAQKVKDVKGNHRLQMKVSSSELVYGYMQKGKLYSFSKRFKEVPDYFSDSFKEKVGQFLFSGFAAQNTMPEGGAVIKVKEVRTSNRDVFVNPQIKRDEDVRPEEEIKPLPDGVPIKGAFEVEGTPFTDGEVLKAKVVIPQPQELPQPIDKNKAYDVVEQMPSFPGGQSALLQWLSSKIKYPKEAEKNGMMGRVIVSFVVERDGSITDIRVVKSVDPSLDREAIRVVSSMPRWKPGMQKGKPVRVKYTVPVTFRLN